MSKPGLATVREYLEVVLVAALFALFAKTFVLEGFEIPSSSMEGNLLVGDRIFVNKFIYAPHHGPWARVLPYRDPDRGDVIVFKAPREPGIDFIKRVVGLPGETVQITRKKVSVNGTPQDEPFAVFRDDEVYSGDPEEPDSLRRRDTWGPEKVPRGCYFALGDNRDNSQDSRYWGFVPRNYLRGRAVLIYFSYDNRVAAGSFSGRGAEVRRRLHLAIHFFERARWDRVLRFVR